MVPFCIALYLLVLTMKTAQSIFFPSSSISRLLSVAHSLISLDRKRLQRDYIEGQYVTSIKEFGLLSRDGASKHRLKKGNFIKDFK